MADMSNSPDQNKDPKKDPKNTENNPSENQPADINPLDVATGVVMRIETNPETGEERPTAVAQVVPVRHDDHYHLAPTGKVLTPVDVDMLGIRSAEDAFRAFEGDSGASRGNSTSIGFTRRYSDRWGDIFNNPENNN